MEDAASADQKKLRPVWVDDSEKTACSCCEVTFSFLNRKHHCRGCGDICCGKCSEHRMELKHFGYVGPQRVCNTCKGVHSHTSIIDDKQDSREFSKIIIQNSITKTDSQGRPLGILKFFLAEEQVFWHKGDERGSILIKDILFVKEQGQTCLVIFAYPIITTNPFIRREKQEIHLQFDKMIQRNTWFTELNLLLLPTLKPIIGDETHLLILLNPMSGERGRSSTALAWEQVEPIFRQSSFQITIRWTSSGAHVHKLAQTLQFRRFKAIVAIGGDGTIHHIINGLMDRKNWESAIRTPIGIIGTGISNGLAAQFDLLDPIHAAFQFIRGNKKNMDLIKLQQGEESRYCFKSINWGLSANLGGTGSWMNMIKIASNIKSYPATIEYLPLEKDSDRTFCTLDESCPQCSSMEPASTGEWRTLQGDFILVTACNLRKAGVDICATPFSHLCDGLIDLVLITSECLKSQLLSMFSYIADGSYVNLPSFNLNKSIQYLRVKSFRLTMEENIGNCNFTADGEILPSLEPIEASNCKSALSFIA